MLERKLDRFTNVVRCRYQDSIMAVLVDENFDLTALVSLFVARVIASVFA